MKSLKKKSIEFLKNISIKEQNIDKELFLTIDSFSENKLYEKAKEGLDYAIKYQNKKGEFKDELSPIYFLNSINIFLKLYKQKKEIKNFIKPIRRSIEYLEKHFDEYYLLIFTKAQEKTFYAKQNAIFLNLADSLAEILNELDYNKDADKIFLLKSKIELGFIRYFYYKKEQILIKSFIPKLNKIEQFNNSNSLQILNIYNFDQEFTKKIISNYKKIITQETNTKNILNYLIALKNQNDITYKKEIEKYKKYLIEFPKKIVQTKDIENLENIKKSLFKDYSSTNINLEKEKITLISPKNISTLNLILKLLKNEK